MVVELDLEVNQPWRISQSLLIGLPAKGGRQGGKRKRGRKEGELTSVDGVLRMD